MVVSTKKTLNSHSKISYIKKNNIFYIVVECNMVSRNHIIHFTLKKIKQPSSLNVSPTFNSLSSK